jgi:hypothetical protein
LHPLTGEPVAAVALGGHHLDDLAPPHDQFSQGLGRGVGQRARLGMDAFGEQGDRLGIERVGLGQPPERAGEVADLARVDHRQRQSRSGERRGHHRLEAAGGFQHHERRRQRRQALDQAFQAFAVARDGEGLTRRQHMNIQTILRHVDADIYLFHDPSLQMRSRTADQATVRVLWNDGRGASLTHGLQDQGGIGLPPATAGDIIPPTAIR